ncbi:unnamed protein product [Soboliphyme baturini]|uniref:Exocyst complex component 2 n=1 Tax=Soboliphyme baturini TaxID=241478 RepID=A0A183IAG9_9BILA|nr:unnamed protein product [Soboliphyme baturini]
MLEDSKEHEWPVTIRLEKLISKCLQGGKGIFEEVLLRKDRADSTGNALSVIQRFRFLFYLPQVMKENLEKGEYALVLNDYSRAKSLLSETEVPLFKEGLYILERLGDVLLAVQFFKVILSASFLVVLTDSVSSINKRAFY